jgi:hypothetical protein
VRVGELIDDLHHVVFEELFLAGIEELDRRVSIRRVGACKPEVQLLAARACGHGAHAELGGAVLVLRERLRVDHMQHQLAA